MYVRNKDIDTMAFLIGLLSNAIENGAEADYWQKYSNDAWTLFEKMKKNRDENVYKNNVKKALTKFKKANKNGTNN
jgi:hypothetical protein